MAASGEAIVDSWTEYQARTDRALRRARELLKRAEALRLMSADLVKQSSRAVERASIAAARTVKTTMRP